MRFHAVRLGRGLTLTSCPLIQYACTASSQAAAARFYDPPQNQKALTMLLVVKMSWLLATVSGYE